MLERSCVVQCMAGRTGHWLGIPAPGIEHGVEACRSYNCEVSYPPPPPSLQCTRAKGAARNVWKFALAKIIKFHIPPPPQNVRGGGGGVCMHAHSPIFLGKGGIFGRLSREDLTRKTYKKDVFKPISRDIGYF